MNFKKFLYQLGLNSDGEVVPNFKIKSYVKVPEGTEVTTPSGEVMEPGQSFSIGNATLNGKPVVGFDQFVQWINSKTESRTAGDYSVSYLNKVLPRGSYDKGIPTARGKFFRLEEEQEVSELSKQMAAFIRSDLSIMLNNFNKKNLSKEEQEPYVLMYSLKRIEYFKTLEREALKGGKITPEQQKIILEVVKTGREELASQVVAFYNSQMAEKIKEGDAQPVATSTEATAAEAAEAAAAAAVEEEKEEKEPTTVPKNKEERKDFFGRVLQQVIQGKIRYRAIMTELMEDISERHQKILNALQIHSFIDSVGSSFPGVDIKNLLAGFSFEATKKEKGKTKKITVKVFDLINKLLHPHISMKNREITPLKDQIRDYIINNSKYKDIHEARKKSSIFKVKDFIEEYFFKETPGKAMKLALKGGSLKKVLDEFTNKKFNIDGTEYSLQEILSLEDETKRRTLYDKYVKVFKSFMESNEFDSLSQGRKNVVEKMYDMMTSPQKDYPSERWPPDSNFTDEENKEYDAFIEKTSILVDHLSLLYAAQEEASSLEARRAQIVIGSVHFEEFSDDPIELIKILHNAAYDLGLNFSNSENSFEDVSLYGPMKQFLEEHSGFSESEEYLSLSESEQDYRILRYYSENSVDIKIPEQIALGSRLKSINSIKDTSPDINFVTEGLVEGSYDALRYLTEDKEKEFGGHVYELGRAFSRARLQDDSKAKLPEEVRQEVLKRRLEAIDNAVDSLYDSGLIKDKELARQFLIQDLIEGKEIKGEFAEKEEELGDVGNFTESAVNFIIASSLMREGSSLEMIDFAFDEEGGRSNKILRVNHADGSYHEILSTGENFGFADAIISHVDKDNNVSLMVLEQKVHAGSKTDVFHFRELKPFANFLDTVATRYNPKNGRINLHNTHQVSIINSGRNSQTIDHSVFVRNEGGDTSNANGDELIQTENEVVAGHNKGKR